VPALLDFQRDWIALFRAVGAREPRAMAELAAALLDSTPDLHADGREYLLMAGMAGAIAAGQRERAVALWTAHEGSLARAGLPAFRLLRCHAQPGDAGACAEAFRPYAED
jgi:hypothetical protein